MGKIRNFFSPGAGTHVESAQYLQPGPGYRFFHTQWFARGAQCRQPCCAGNPNPSEYNASAHSQCRPRPTLYVCAIAIMLRMLPTIPVRSIRLRNLHGAPTQLKAGDSPMSKEQRSNKETKKVAAMTPKEKRAAKKAKKENKGILGT